MDIRNRHSSSRPSSGWLDEDPNNNNNEKTPLLKQNNNNNSQSNYSQPNNSSPADDSIITQILDYIYESALYIWNSLFSSGDTSPNALQPSWTPPPEVQNRMNSFKEYISTPYDSQNDQHEQMLMKLWKLAFPNEQLNNRKTKQWGKLGFQGVDPATDFRGVGVFGLSNLVHFAERYPKYFQKCLLNAERKQKEFGDYPFAITGFGLTVLIFEMFGWGNKPKQLTSLAKQNLLTFIFSDDSTMVSNFEELFFYIFLTFDQLWFRHDASIMDYQKIYALTFEALSKELERISTLQHLQDRISKF